MKPLPPLDLLDSLLPGPLVFHKLKHLLGDEDLKSFDLLACIKIDPCLILQFLNFSIRLDPKLKKRSLSLEGASATLKKTDIQKFIQLELLKADGFPYSREFSIHYAELWQEALFSAAFLEVAAPVLNVEADFAYTLGLLGPVDRIVTCFLEYTPTTKTYIQSKDKNLAILANLLIPEVLLSILIAYKEQDLRTKEPLADALSLSAKLHQGQKITSLPAHLGITIEALPSLYKKTEKRLQDLKRFIGVF